MDSNDLERERGITILSKCTSVNWKDTHINIVDTPGHADFGGEVERILKMVDGVVLLVDAAEGPMPQTKFVTGKALALGLRPIVLINKIDRGDARPEEVLDEVFELFIGLDAKPEQLDFPYLFAVGRDGWASEDHTAKGGDLGPLFEMILRHVPAPDVDVDAPFAMVATMLDADPYLGRVLTGRITAGRIRQNDSAHAIRPDGRIVETARITKLLAYHGLERTPVEEAEAGDIIAIAGLEKATVADTIADRSVTVPLPSSPIDPPTLAMTFSINDSPLAGRDGSKVQSRVIRDRLMREAEGNVAIKISDTGSADTMEVAGRGELQLAVLVENMRREGFELTIGRPRVLFRSDPQTGQRLEPIEEVTIDVDEEYSGTVVEMLSTRRAELKDMRTSSAAKSRLVFHAPSRALIGFHGDFLTATRGTGVLNRVFHSFEPYKGPIPNRNTGSLVSTDAGKAVPYALWNLEERGVLFIDPGIDVYPGMVIGENAKRGDLEVNPLKGKQLSNIRTTSKDEAVRLTTPRRMTLEQAIAHIADDECVEVTPHFIRIRKTILDPHERKRERRAAQAEAG